MNYLFANLVVAWLYIYILYYYIIQIYLQSYTQTYLFTLIKLFVTKVLEQPVHETLVITS